MLCHTRPDYKKLGVLKQQFPDIPIIALTATATETVCQARRSSCSDLFGRIACHGTLPHASIANPCK